MGMKETEIVHIAIENLEKNAPVKCLWENQPDKYTDGRLTLHVDKDKITFYTEIKKELRAHQIPQIEKNAKDFPPYLILAQCIFPKIKEQLRQLNIAYLEANGNIFMNKDRFHYFIDANKPFQLEKEKVNRAFTKTGLKVLFHFLINEKWINLPHREIAEIIQVAHGNFAYIFNGLMENNFLIRLNKRTYRLNNKKELLEKWMVAWKETLQPALKIGRFRFADDINFTHYGELHLDENTTWWGGEPAGDILTHYLRPGELILYTRKNRNELMKDFRLIPDPNGDVKIFRAFWKTKEAVRNNIVHPVLVYADLMNTGNSRCYETAQMIWDKYLANEF
jgi:hypothetical protein